MRIVKARWLDSSRGRVVELLRAGAQTAEDIASSLGLTPSAVRAQLTAMERDGVARRAGQRPGVTRPSQVFELTPEIEQFLSSAYVPLLTDLVEAMAEALPAPRMETLLRDTGRRLAETLCAGTRPTGDLAARVAAASELLNSKLGAMTTVESDRAHVIRSVGCPLASLTSAHPVVCKAMESLIGEIVGARAHERCAREGRLQCRFEIRSAARRRQRSPKG
jgi:predicted ArsR family transcriptional regulator